MKKKFFKIVAHTLLLSFGYQLVFPAYAYALTTGPSQPEVQSFEPVGTTEMVDMFTGDFNYNIPLLDVEGYPVNIFYHSGVGIEQEASWVGLGWNINPGEINRTVRGLPDDFKGDRVEKTLYIKKEVDVRIGIGANVAMELFGKKMNPEGGKTPPQPETGENGAQTSDIKFSLGSSLYIAHNNYRGLSSGISYSGGLSSPVASVGLGMGVGTQTGADIDLSGSWTPRIIEKQGFGTSFGVGIGYNSRSGLKDLNLKAEARSSNPGIARMQKITGAGQMERVIPIGLQNYVPVHANRIQQQGFSLQFKLGMSTNGATVSAYVQGNRAVTEYKPDGSLDGYGYLYLQESGKADMLDFSREKDGVYNETVKNLPLSALTYDAYTVNGHGTGGMFRPFRNDIGTIHDPYIKSDNNSNTSAIFEGGIPGSDYGEIGDDFNWINTVNESGPWPEVYMNFSGKKVGSLYENVFFKQAGELTYNQQQEAASVFNTTPHFLDENLSALFGKGKTITGFLPHVYEESAVPVGHVLWDNRIIDRSSRATNISYQTAEQVMSIPEMLLSKQIASHDGGSNFYTPNITKYDRYGSGAGGRKAKAHHISEFTQTMPDGRRYVYGIPALNNVSREVTVAIDESTADINKGYVDVPLNEENNNMGRDNFYSSTTTPAHAHAYLLTALLSADYVDILGDGPTDDDLGTYVKYNYSRKSNDYRWRTPYEPGKAQYNPGFWSDSKDGKGNYMTGSREQWILRTIETKNYIAEFSSSARSDGKGVLSAVTRSGDYSSAAAAGSNLSYKLDEIRLYNKHDRHMNGANAVPVKTVIFRYNYSLCKGVPNGTSGGGKLTLEKIFIKYGKSQKNLLSPYVFEYQGQNPDYNFAAKDRWGNYKKVVPGIHNYEFPYTEQPDVPEDQDDLLSSWNLTDIKLPSGGKIHVDYESDDYSFVQDKRAMQMLQITGVGRSKTMVPQNRLYTGENDINQYIYFKRRSNEGALTSMKDKYFEGQDMLYYSFATDIANTGKFEPVKGYAKIEEVGVCEGNTDFGYVKVATDAANKMPLHPAALMGINMGRYYLPHIFYDGYTSESIFSNLLNLLKTYPELVRTIGGQNPFQDFIKKNKAMNIRISNSWIRVQTPALTKRGGGIRVKMLGLSDNWGELSGNKDASYGRQYDYTVTHERYGKISSGVASYEPMIGADENPFRKPVPYAVESGRLIPSIDFFQEEPFGESFFPPASVGYSSVTVKSIHQEHGRSAQALDEYLFYTSKDYPLQVEYTDKDASGSGSDVLLRKDFREAKARQGYCLRFNDMHGKPKAVNNYVIHQNPGWSTQKNELITGKRFIYNEDFQRNLSNIVRALVRKRGTENTFEVRNMLLGQDMDFTVDSRYTSSVTSKNPTQFNLNVLQALGIPAPIPSFFGNLQGETVRKFQSLVTTKIIQQYGILKKIESYDHGARTVTENMVFDAETGNTLLTSTTNEFTDYTGNLIHPAYLAYEGMRPAYTNDGYEELMDSLVVGYDRNGYLYTNNFDRFSKGDELLVKTKGGVFKLWVLGTGADISIDTTPPVPDSGEVSIAMVREKPECSRYAAFANVDVFTSANVQVASKRLDADIIGEDICGKADALNVKLPIGNYYYTVRSGDPVKTLTFSFTITKNKCLPVPLKNTGCIDMGTVVVSKTAPNSALVRKKDSWYMLQGKSYSYQGYIDHNTYNSGDETFEQVKHCDVAVGLYAFQYMNGTNGPYTLLAPVVKDNITFIKISQGFAKKPTASYFLIAGSCAGVVPGAIPVLPISIGHKGGGDNASRTTKETEVTTPLGPVTKRCALLVAPRYKDKFSGATNVSSWPQVRKRYMAVSVKVLRSGHRNNLNQSVQQTSFAVDKDQFALHTLDLNSLFVKTGALLSASAQTYTDEAQMYSGFLNEMNIANDYKYAQFNPYVLGTKGNYRVQSTFAPVTGRSYANYSRKDGSFGMPSVNQFWTLSNSRVVPEGTCDGPTDLFVENSRTGPQYWKMASKVTRYDIFGNALEEQDAIGNFSSAQYGYNKALPVSVATNAKHGQFMFESFEDYNMLLPEKIAELFLKGDQYSAFALIFSNVKWMSGFNRYDQRFFLRDIAPASSVLMLAKNISHSGYYSMYNTGASEYTYAFNTGNPASGEISPFRFATGTKYLVQFWAKRLSGTKFSDGDIKIEHNSTVVNTKVKTGSIDGWYQVEAIVDVTSSAAVNLKIPGNIYIDDIRALPSKANMKSFVYDPLNFRLMAQLDENNFATFFEYDQEGLLLRTKKETAKGIMTISESRRANSKLTDITPGEGSSGGGGTETPPDPEY
jgi:hypothetical protein